jgi:hypothetical protein
VKDPRGNEKLAAFGRYSTVSDRSQSGGLVKVERDQWTPDWMILCDVLPAGTVDELMQTGDLESSSDQKLDRLSESRSM